MKHILFIIIIAAVAVGLIAWFQAKPVSEPRVSVTNGTQDLAQEAQTIDIGTADDGFQTIDADIEQL